MFIMNSESNCSSPALSIPDADASRLLNEIMQDIWEEDFSINNMKKNTENIVPSKITIISNDLIKASDYDETDTFVENNNIEIGATITMPENTEILPTPNIIVIHDDNNVQNEIFVDNQDTENIDPKILIVIPPDLVNNKFVEVGENNLIDNNDDNKVASGNEQQNEDIAVPPTKKLTRKRVRCPEQWAENVRKEKRARGVAYTDRKGNNHPPRRIHGECRPHCTYKCKENIDQEGRRKIFNQFWQLSDGKKSHFYSKYVSRGPVERRRGKSDSKKQYTYDYRLEINGEKYKVCKEYFLGTLNISSRRIYYFFNHVQNNDTNVPRSPKRGKHKKEVVSEDDKNLVRAHINSFKTIESHYCRASSNKNYLESALCLKRMYELYKEHLSIEKYPVKLSMYSHIFNIEFNLSFFKPKKDLCDKCEEFKFITDPTDRQIQDHQDHLNRKELGIFERNIDRHQEDCSVAVITFDLENVFALPKCNVSKVFYLRKLNCYNLTGHCSTNGITYCSIWHEYLTGRAANNLASALVKILKYVMADNPELKKIILWSDSCVPQNKNSVMSIALQHFLQSRESKNLESIEQKFSEPGHGNLQEIDAVHSVIERYLRHKDIKSPVSLIRLLSNMPKSFKTNLKVLQMRMNDFLNYQTISQQLTFNAIPYTKVKQIIYKNKEQQIPFKVSYRNSFHADFEIIIVKKLKKLRGSKNQSDQFPVEIPVLIEKSTGLTKDKKDHLELMLKIMDGADLEFYQTILKKATKARNK